MVGLGTLGMVPWFLPPALEQFAVQEAQSLGLQESRLVV